MVAKLLRLVCQIVRVYSDTVSAHKTRHKFEEIPLRSRGFQHCLGVNVHLMENHGKLIHERNVDVSLAVLDNLCRLSDFDGLRPVYAGFHNEFVHFSNNVKRLLIHT